MKKVRLATVWLDGCSGCHMSLLDIDEAILAIAHRRMQQELQAAWDSRTPDVPLANPQEALVLASIPAGTLQTK